MTQEPVLEGYSLVKFGRPMRLTQCGEVSTPHVYASFLGSLHGSLSEVAETLPPLLRFGVLGGETDTDEREVVR